MDQEDEILNEEETQEEEKGDDDGEIRRKVVKKTTYKIDEVSLNFRYGLMLHFKVFSSTGKS
jgi:hypothetical protein